MDGQTQLLIFVLDERCYALHLSRVQSVIRAVDAVPLPNGPKSVLGIIDFHGLLIPLLDVRRRFGIVEREIAPSDEFVIAFTATRTVALAVDRVVGIKERPAEKLIPPEKISDDMKLISGAIQLEEGLVFIHDLDRFLSSEEEVALGDALTRHQTHASHGI